MAPKKCYLEASTSRLSSLKVIIYSFLPHIQILDKNGCLDKDEFEAWIYAIYDNFPPCDIEKCFKMYDTKKEKCVTANEILE